MKEKDLPEDMKLLKKNLEKERDNWLKEKRSK
jgi:hypothetical protein